MIHLATERREEHKEVSIDWTRHAISWVTNGRVADASKTLLANSGKKGCPSRRTQERNQKEDCETLEEEMNQFRQKVTEYVNSNSISPSRRIMLMR